MRRFKPCLSGKIYSTDPRETEKNFSLLRFPLLGSAKYDGIRMFEYNMGLTTRSMKPVRNRFIAAQTRELFSLAKEKGLRGLDGEIGVGSPTDPNFMQNTSSGVMSYEGEPEFGLYLFDSYQNSQNPFRERFDCVKKTLDLFSGRFPWLHEVEQVDIPDMERLLSYEEEQLARGFEGVMIRDPEGRYKMGRSTVRENILLALKRFTDSEALILEYHEELENLNEAFENALGHLERSSHQENLIPKGRMGTMLAWDPNFPKNFHMGNGRGLTHGLREEIWTNPKNFQWKIGSYVYQDLGIRERPRLPRWNGWRSWDDLDPEKRQAFLDYARNYAFSGKGLSALSGPPPG